MLRSALGVSFVIRSILNRNPRTAVDGLILEQPFVRPEMNHMDEVGGGIRRSTSGVYHTAMWLEREHLQVIPSRVTVIPEEWKWDTIRRTHMHRA